MIFVLKMLFTFVYDRFNWSLLIIRYSLITHYSEYKHPEIDCFHGL